MCGIPAPSVLYNVPHKIRRHKIPLVDQFNNSSEASRAGSPQGGPEGIPGAPAAGEAHRLRRPLPPRRTRIPLCFGHTPRRYWIDPNTTYKKYSGHDFQGCQVKGTGPLCVVHGYQKGPVPGDWPEGSKGSGGLNQGTHREGTAVRWGRGE